MGLNLVTDRQTDTQIDKFFYTIYRGMWIFSFSWICYLPTCFARRGITEVKNWNALEISLSLEPENVKIRNEKTLSFMKFWKFEFFCFLKKTIQSCSHYSMRDYGNLRLSVFCLSTGTFINDVTQIWPEIDLFPPLSH